MSTDIYFGIDFGTTNSAMAWYNLKTGRAETIRNADKEHETPSLVYCGEGETLVGKDVPNLLEEVEGSGDQAERDDINLRVVKSIKRKLTEPIVALPGGKTVRPVEVVAHILKKLKRDAEEGHFREEIKRVVLTHPATFDIREQKALREAAGMAGFGETELIEEPTAAALAFSRLGQRVGNGVLVYDLGAGTFDLSVVTRDAEGSFYVSMKPQGDPRCGGNDFDLALYRHCDEIAQKELGRPISLSGETDLAFLAQCCQRKENLSSRETSRFGSYLASEDGPSVRFRHEVYRKDFEELIRDRVEETVRKTGLMLEQARTRGQEVDAVVLIGGSSRIPLVKQRLAEELSIELVDFAEKDYAVALGAAYHAFELWKPQEEVLDGTVSVSAAEGLRQRERDHSVNVSNVSSHEGDASGDDVATERPVEQDTTLPEAESERLDKPFIFAHIRTISNARPKKKSWFGRLLESSNRVDSVTFSPDGQTIAGAISGAGEVRLWEMQTGQLVTSITANYGVEAVAFSPDGQSIAYGDMSPVDYDVPGRWENITLRDVRTGDQLWSLTLHANDGGYNGGVNSVTFSPDGETLASGGDRWLHVWNVRTGELLWEARNPDPLVNKWVSSVAFSPDGQLLASNADNELELWDAHDGRLVQALPGHSGFIMSITFSLDGQFLASSSDDETIRIWERNQSA